MIQMADVGVGISGQKGSQAIMASDFSMGQSSYVSRPDKISVVEVF